MSCLIGGRESTGLAFSGYEQEYDPERYEYLSDPKSSDGSISLILRHPDNASLFFHVPNKLHGLDRRRGGRYEDMNVIMIVYFTAGFSEHIAETVG